MAQAAKFVGHPGGPFVVAGSGFGKAPGRVLLGNKAMDVTAWRDDRIKGVVPRDAALTPTATVEVDDGPKVVASVNDAVAPPALSSSTEPAKAGAKA